MTQYVLIEGQNVPIDSQQARDYLSGLGLRRDTGASSGVSADVPDSPTPTEPVQNPAVDTGIIDNNPYLTRDRGVITRAVLQDNGAIAYEENFGERFAAGSTSISDTDDDNYYAAMRWIRANPDAQFIRRTEDIEKEASSGKLAYNTIKPTGNIYVVDVAEGYDFQATRRKIMELPEGTAIAFKAPGTEQGANFNQAGRYYAYGGGASGMLSQIIGLQGMVQAFLHLMLGLILAG